MDQWDDTHRGASAWLLGDDDFGDDAAGLAMQALGSTGLVGQGQAAVTGALGQAQSMGAGAIAAGAADVNSALTGAGVPPDIANAATSALSGAAMQGFGKVMHSITSIPSHLFGGLFHHHQHVAAIPAVASTIASLPPSQQAGAQAAANLVHAVTAGATPIGTTPAAQAASLIAAGAAAQAAQGAAAATLPAAASPWIPTAAGGAFAGVGAIITGLAAPVALVATAVGAGLGYLASKFGFLKIRKKDTTMNLVKKVKKRLSKLAKRYGRSHTAMPVGTRVRFEDAEGAIVTGTVTAHLPGRLGVQLDADPDVPGEAAPVVEVPAAAVTKTAA